MKNTMPPERPSILISAIIAIGQAPRRQRIYRVDGAKELPLVGRQLDPFAVVSLPGALGR
jgi:hypothetical protein